MSELKDVAEVFLAFEVLLVFVVVNIFFIGIIVMSAASALQKKWNEESDWY